MEKRRYTKIQELLSVIQAMQEAGKSRKEIEEELGLSGDQPVHNLLKRERRKQEKREKGIMTQPKGRPRKDGQLLQEQQKHYRQTYGYRRMWMWLEKQGIPLQFLAFQFP